MQESPAFGRTTRNGFTLVELLVALAIIAVLIALLVPAVQKVREAANYVTCSNNMRQIGLASHNVHDQFRRLPPGLGWFPNNTGPGAYGTVFFHLLPYLDQNNLYESSFYSSSYFAGNNNVYSQPIAVFRCPSDPSLGTGAVVTDTMGVTWGASNYAANAQVVARTDATGAILSPQFMARIPATFVDGASNTILYAERYAQCSNAAYPEGGSLWAYWFTGPGLKHYHSGFSISWNGYSIGPGSKFQVRPSPFNGMCDPTLAATPHAAGMHVGMGDASVRFLGAQVSAYTWWYLCTPNGGEMIPGDAF